MKKVIFYIILGCCYLTQSNSQISYGGYPHSKRLLMNNENVPVIEMPTFDDSGLKSINASLYKSKVFAKAFDVEINPTNSGLWTINDDGTKTWRVAIKSKNAKSLLFSFSPFYLPDNAKLFIYNNDYSKILGAYTSKNNSKYKALSVEPVSGEMAYIELLVPEKFIDIVELTLKNVGHGLLDFNDSPEKNFLNIGDCHPDANCFLDPDWENVKNATFFYIYYNYKEKVYKYCNGTLINNTRQDGHPYFLSANHCIWDDSTANTVVAFFNYETRYCNGPELPKSKTISGAKIVATINKLDYSLSEFESSLPILYKPYMAGWDRITDNPENVICIHHPADELRIYPKMVANDLDQLEVTTFSNEYDKNSHYLIKRWDIGTTESGSSGSAIFDQNKRIVGDLTGGPAECEYPVNDYFTRFSVSWDSYPEKENQLKYWLDPVSTGVGTLDGLDPYQSFKDSCDTLRKVSRNPVIINYNNNFSFRSGHNEDRVRYFAQYFKGEKNNTITAVYFNVAYARSSSSNSAFDLIVWSSNNGEPGAIISKKEYLISDIKEDAVNYLEFDSLISIQNDFFIGFEIYYSIPRDTFAVYQSENTTSVNDNYYIYNDSWENIEEFSSGLVTGALDISVVRCDSLISNINPDIVKSGLHYSIYPNPAQNYVLIDFEKSNHSNLEIRIFNMAGKLMRKDITPISYNLYSLNLSGFIPGIYFLSVQSESATKVSKIVVFK